MPEAGRGQRDGQRDGGHGMVTMGRENARGQARAVADGAAAHLDEVRTGKARRGGRGSGRAEAAAGVAAGVCRGFLSPEPAAMVEARLRGSRFVAPGPRPWQE